MEAMAVEGDDAGGFLAAMLEGVKPEGGDGGGVGVTVDAEHAAFFPKRIAVAVQIDVALVAFACGGRATGEVAHRVTQPPRH
ncbi:hypothetical protein GCM10022626_27380 [[Pseudomonas] carboxydohydrogena]